MKHEKGLSKSSNKLKRMPNIQRQNKAISEFNKVVGEQLEQQQSQKAQSDSLSHRPDRLFGKEWQV